MGVIFLPAVPYLRQHQSKGCRLTSRPKQQSGSNTMRTLRWILLSLYLVGCTALAMYGDSPGMFVLVAAAIVSLAVFLRSIGTQDLCLPVSPARLILPIALVASLLTALTASLVLALIELTEVDDHGPEWTQAAVWVFFGGSWVGLAALLFVHVRRRIRFRVLSRLTAILFASSLVQLVVTVPSHLIVIRRPGCLTGMLTGIGLLVGIYVTFWSLGPAIMLLFLMDSYRQQRNAPLCLACGYDLRGSIPAGSTACPECGEPIPTQANPAASESQSLQKRDHDGLNPTPEVFRMGPGPISRIVTQEQVVRRTE